MFMEYAVVNEDKYSVTVNTYFGCFCPDSDQLESGSGRIEVTVVSASPARFEIQPVDAEYTDRPHYTYHSDYTYHSHNAHHSDDADHTDDSHHTNYTV